MEKLSDDLIAELVKVTEDDILFWHTAYPGSFSTRIGKFQLFAWHGPESDMLGVQVYDDFGGGLWHKAPTPQLIYAIQAQQERHKGLQLGRQGPLFLSAISG